MKGDFFISLSEDDFVTLRVGKVVFKHFHDPDDPSRPLAVFLSKGKVRREELQRTLASGCKVSAVRLREGDIRRIEKTDEGMRGIYDGFTITIVAEHNYRKLGDTKALRGPA